MLLAQISDRWVEGLFTVWGMIIVGIITGTIVTVTRMVIRHRERIAMIERGMRPPDTPDEPDEE